MSDSSEIEDALLALLRSDATLAALLPGGWWMDEGPAGQTRFGIVSLVDEHDEPMFGGRAFEDALYLVQVVARSTKDNPLPPTLVKDAAARLDVLLDPQPPLLPATFTIAGYGLMVSRRESRVRSTEVDDVDSSIRWFHRGGRYQVMVAAVS